MTEELGRLKFYEYKKVEENLKPELLSGLRESPKHISPKFFYDKNGSQLFDQITNLEEYYPTEKEISILRDHINEICSMIGENSALIEYGGANLRKISIILDHCKGIAYYIPIDISTIYMQSSVNRLLNQYEDLSIMAISADFTKPIRIPDIEKFSRRTILFLGSSIGNFEPDELLHFLMNAHETIEEGDCLIIGADLRKDSAILNRAYNDNKGVTAAFNLNLITRINREFGSELSPELFQHFAGYNAEKGRIEMYLKVLDNFKTNIGGEEIVFRKNELIHTENSYKFTIEGFSDIVEKAGFKVGKVWTDEENYYSVFIIVK